MLWRLIRSGMAPHRTAISLIVALQLASTIASLYLPNLNGDIIDQGVTKGDTGYIMRTGGVMLAISLVQIAASVYAVYLSARTSMAFGRDTRAQVFHRVGEFSAREVAQFGAPTLISRSTNDVQQIQMVVFMALSMMVSAPIMMVGGVIMALRTDVGLSWLVAVAVPVLAITVALVLRQMLPKFRVMQDSVDSVNRILREQITGIRVVRAFVREPFERTRFAVANGTLTGSALGVGRLMALVFPIVMLILNASTVGVLWFGAHRVEAGDMQVGALTAFMSYLIQILMSVMMATMMSMMIPRAAVSAERITAVLDTQTSVVLPAHPDTHLATPAAVTFDHVDYHYPGAERAVLDGVSFEARPGETTAVIGSTGSGKTTLLGLIPRLFDATGGRVLVGGVDVRNALPDALWSHLGLVPQKPYLFSGTVATNLRYGKGDASDDELWEALRIAQAEGFVREMPGGLDAPIAQGGTNVSGGQRQRLAIARALVRRPDVYLFDDSFSALDLTTDARLRSALRPVTRNATVIVVAQRVSTIIDAEQIIVLDDGHVVGAGRHTDLLESCPTYQEIVGSQRAAQEVPA
ncbi:MAG TPA: ABC transporter ATP-binding protein [Candidatus Lustribacter sp.]|nr:ABC transporter ATP-binding protein [Candidatus Lustribacter sp.]